LEDKPGLKRLAGSDELNLPGFKDLRPRVGLWLPPAAPMALTGPAPTEGAPIEPPFPMPHGAPQAFGVAGLPPFDVPLVDQTTNGVDEVTQKVLDALRSPVKAKKIKAAIFKKPSACKEKKPNTKVKKASPVKKPAVVAKKAPPRPESKSKISSALRKALPFPGKPKKRCEAMPFKDYMIYTDVNHETWRVKQNGVRTDRSSSFKHDPVAAWEKVLQILVDA
jgi:hypothetical protein